MGRILVIEDEFLVAAHIDSILVDDGLEVIGPVAALADALQIAKHETMDGALLDVSIHGGRVDDVAATLDRRSVPFIFVTSYGQDNLPKQFRDKVVISKPFRDDELLREVRRFAGVSV